MSKVSTDAAARLLEKRIAKLHSKATPPEREEWAMFKDCPAAQMRACLEYEYCRASKRIGNLITAWRKRHSNEVVDSQVSWIFGKSGLLPLSAPVSFYLLQIPAFPQTPFLKLPDDCRKIKIAEEARLEHLHGYKCEPLINEYGGCESEITVGEGFNTTTYAVFGIPWRHSNKQLRDAFVGFLTQNRKHPAYEKRGRNELRSELKQLGALRLLREMTPTDAATHTQNILGYPLYSRDTAWTRAQQEAEKALQEFLSFALPTINI